MATDGMPAYGVEQVMPMQEGIPTPADPGLPAGGETGPLMEPGVPADPAAGLPGPSWQRTAAAPNRSILHNRPAGSTPPGGATSTPGLIGPIGYDVEK